MIGHIERHPGVRDRAIFVGVPEDIIPMSFGKDLPAMPDWVPKHFEFSGYIIGEHLQTFGHRMDLRRALGYRPDERVCVVTVGGSGVGTHLVRRILESYPMARAKLPELRMILVGGPRIDPASLNAPAGVEVRAFEPNLDRHLAASDLAIVQGCLTTCMELVAAGTPFIYFPLKTISIRTSTWPTPFRPLRCRKAHGVCHVDTGHDRGRDGCCVAIAHQVQTGRSRGAARAARMLADLI